MLVLADRRGPLARFRVEDSIRNDARGTCVRLAEAGYSLALLSGDAPEAVASAAAAVGIDAWRGRQLPQQKLDYVAARQREGHVVAMFGDGVNDAAVLAGADVSIALGSGAALAHAAADFVLLDARLAALPEALAIARAARRIVRQNLAWAVAYNLAALPLAALGLVPPWAAALGMSVSSLVVTLNALRLAYVRCGEPQADRVGGRPRPAPSAALPPSCVQADAGVSA
jgi:Cu2+-exporting ATPase